MSLKISLKISHLVSSLINKATPKVRKLQAVHDSSGMSALEFVIFLIILSQESDQELKIAAIKALRSLSEEQLLEIVGHPETHHQIIDTMARIYWILPEIASQIAVHPLVDDITLDFLHSKNALPSLSDNLPETTDDLFDVEIQGDDRPDEFLDNEEITGQSEEFLSKYKLSQIMGIGEKIKTALTGDKEWRSLLIKDSNKLVSTSVVKNPRITEAEVLTIAKSAVQIDEILRIICMNKEWLKNYQIRKALALNNKTPLPSALRYVATLTEKDLSSIAKSKNVSSVIATQARRLLTNKKR